MKVIIIEDEELATAALLRLVEQHAPFMEIAGVAPNATEGLQIAERVRPDIIFLDINLPGLNGFQIVNRLSFRPWIIFTTAYDEHALKAFDLHTIDYLLKPIEDSRFIRAVEKIRTFRGATPPIDLEAVERVKKAFDQPFVSSITVRIRDRILFFGLDEVTHFFAEDKYVLLNTLSSEKHITSFTLQDMQERLPSLFVRVSRSVIINVRQIQEAQKLFGKRYEIVMKDVKRSKIETGSAYVDNFLDQLKL